MTAAASRAPFDAAARLPQAASYILLALVAASLAACDSGAAVDEAAAARGKVVARACQSCHSFGEEDKVGPHLEKVVGRTAGTVPGYEFSEAMRKSGIVWTEEKLREFLRSPADLVPGTKMALSPLTEQQARDVVEFIKSQD
jgi:cytochrome c